MAFMLSLQSVKTTTKREVTSRFFSLKRWPPVLPATSKHNFETCAGSVKMDPTRKKPRAKPLPVQKAARNYVFTINFAEVENPNEQLRFQNVPRLLDPEQWPMCKYCIYSLELGEDGTHHFQGYLELNGMHRFTALKLMPGLERAHFEPRRGTQADNIKYCSKDDETHLEGPWIWGEPARQGQRSDLLDVQIKLDNRVPLMTIAKDHFGSWIRHSKAFMEYKRMVTPKRNFKTKVILFVGPSGKGKSTLMECIAPMLGTVFDCAQPKNSGLYFDGYDGQDVLVMDEFDGFYMKPTFFNKLCDRFQCTLPVHHGAGHQMVSKYILIGTNYLPRQWWKNRNAGQLVQTTRRIDVVFKIGFKDMPRWDHSGFQVFGPNINQPRAQPGDVYPPEYYDDLPPLEEGHAE